MMRQLLIGVGVLWLLLGASLVGAAPAQEVTDAFPLTDDEIEIVALKIDLLESAALTLQWKREALVRDQGLLQRNNQLLVQENAAWAAWRDDLQAELDGLFACAYDMTTKACAVDAEEPTP